MHTVLVVDDEPKIVDMINLFLTKEGFRVVTALDGEQALSLFGRQTIDLVVLDWMMPGMSGLEVMRAIRAIRQTPIILLTAKAEEVDKLLGLEIGADDYITKPFSLRELVARIRVILRRIAAPSGHLDELYQVGTLQVHAATHEVFVEDRKVETLTPTEFKLLSLLIQNPGRVFSRLQLMDGALGEAYEGYERSLDTHVRNLRKKIESDPANPAYVLTVYGIGYKMATGGLS